MININKIIKKGKFQLWSLHKDQCRKEHKLYYLFWECTLNCNLYCKHCGSNAGGSILENELKKEEIKKAFQGIAEDFNPKKIMIAVTGGEPLMRKDVFEVMKFAHKLGFSWGMVSNGFLINSEIIEKMIDSGMESIAISIDGDEKTHDEFRGVKGSYKKAIEAIKLLTKNKDIKLAEVVTSAHSKNIDQLQEMYETFILLGVKYWRLMNVDSNK
jgi:MoaA/NifB/PqqE/SkfB family radical SAM enzyme